MHRWLQFIAGILILALTNCLVAAEPAAEALQLQQTIALSGVEGRIDHLDLDAAGERLFVCALGNNSVEVLDLRKGERIHSIGGLGAPQGVVYLPGFGRLLIANDKNGLCQIYDAKSWQSIGTVALQDDADNVRYDSVHKEIFVGFGSGGIAVINPEDGKQTGSIKLAAHPEAFALEKQGRRIFVNAPNAAQVAVIDRDKREVTATWKPGTRQQTFHWPSTKRTTDCFSGAGIPRSSSFSTPTREQSWPASMKFFTMPGGGAYVVCGSGSIDIVEQTDSNHYKLISKVPTAAGARTGLFVPEHDTLFVAVPHHGSQRAEIRRYQVK